MTIAVLAKFSLDFGWFAILRRFLPRFFGPLISAVVKMPKTLFNVFDLKKFEITFNLMGVIDEDFFFFNDSFLTKLRSCG